MRRINSKVQPILWEHKKLSVLDQRLLPYEKKYIEIPSYRDVISAIKDMVVRGAPLIGITAAYGVALAANEFKKLEADNLINKLKIIGEEIKSSRPTAINLKWAVDLVLNTIFELRDTDSIISAVEKRAKWIHNDDIDRCEKIGEHGASLIQDVIARRLENEIASPLTRNAVSILTICNTGALATGGIGTAFGVILTAHRNNYNVHVYASETRPRQQGAKLTTFECFENGIECTLISDTACGHMMQKGNIDLVITGADRISANGDTANKIGTYQLAVLAKEHNIPFYIAAPLSTFDLSINSGVEIPIEERDEKEVKEIHGKHICVKEIKASNPAFDVTPGKYISGIITEKGILKGDLSGSIKKIFNAMALV